MNYTSANLIRMTNKMQLCRTILLFHCFLTAVRFSSDIIAHNQEHLNCNYSFWFYSRLLLPAAVMVEWELAEASVGTAAGNDKRE